MSKVSHIPSKVLSGLSDEELMTAYSGVQALLEARIPAAMSYADTGVLYDSRNNEIGRMLTFTWLTVRGEAILTRIQKGVDLINAEDVQTLANGIAKQYREYMQSLNPQVAANDSEVN